MPRGLPFHSTHPDYPKDVYHDHPDCSEAKKIRLIHRKPGTADRPKCKECENSDNDQATVHPSNKTIV